MIRYLQKTLLRAATAVVVGLGVAFTTLGSLTTPASAAIIPLGFFDESLIHFFSAADPLGTIVVDNAANPCTIFVIINCVKNPTAAFFTDVLGSASAETDGVGGSTLTLLRFNDVVSSLDVETEEAGIFAHTGGPDLITLEAFFPTISIAGLLGDGMEISYLVTILFDSTVVFTTSGRLTGTSSGGQVIPSTAGEDIGAQFDPTTSTLGVDGYFLRLDLGTVTGNSSFEVAVKKTLSLTASTGADSLEFAEGSIVDPNGLSPRLSIIATPIAPMPAIPLPAALPLFGTGLGILGFLGWRRRRQLRLSN